MTKKTKSERLTGKCPTCGKTVGASYNEHHDEFFLWVHRAAGKTCESSRTVAAEINFEQQAK